MKALVLTFLVVSPFALAYLAVAGWHAKRMAQLYRQMMEDHLNEQIRQAYKIPPILKKLADNKQDA